MMWNASEKYKIVISIVRETIIIERKGAEKYDNK